MVEYLAGILTGIMLYFFATKWEDIPSETKNKVYVAVSVIFVSVLTKKYNDWSKEEGKANG